MHYKDNWSQTHGKHVIAANTDMIVEGNEKQIAKQVEEAQPVSYRGGDWEKERKQKLQKMMKWWCWWSKCCNSKWSISWPYSDSDRLSWRDPASDSTAERCISFPAVHQTDRETGSPDLSTSISNTVLIPSGSKKTASFASLSLWRNRRLPGNPPSPPGLNGWVWSINSSPLALA